MGNQIAIPHALWLLLQGLNMLRERDPQLRWVDAWSFFKMQSLSMPWGTMWMQRRTPFRVGEDIIAQLTHLPMGICWTPELGNILLKDYMALNGQLLPPQCLRPMTRHTTAATQPTEIEATQPFRLLARCRIMFTTGAKGLQVEQTTPIEAVTSLWKASARD